MRTVALIGIVVAAIAATGASLVWLQSRPPASPSTDPPTTDATVSPADALPAGTPSPAPVTAEGGPALSPLALPVFAQKEFHGTNFTVGRVLAETATYTRHYITYRSGELTISGIMNMPKGNGPFPVLILNHGYIDPAIYTNGRGLKREQDYLAQRGYVVIHPDYRNHADSSDEPNPEERFRLGYVEDVINAVHAIRAANLPRVDATRVGMLGHSMGGGVAQTIAVTQPGLVDAIVLFAPVSTDARDNFAKWTTRRPETAQKIIAAHGTPEDNPEFWDSISPINYLKDVTVPVMFHHGTADDSVPLEWSERTAAELEALQKDVTLHIYPGEPHEFTNAWPQVMQRTVEFFDQQLAS